jgi:hypothetical protein
MIGWMHNCKGGKKKVGHDHQTCPCPYCQASMHKFGQVLNQQTLPTETTAWDNDQGEYVRSVPIYNWKLNPKTIKVITTIEEFEDPKQLTRKKQPKKGTKYEEPLSHDLPDSGLLYELQTGLCERCNQPLELLPDKGGMLILHCPSCIKEGLSRASSVTSRHEVPT